MISAILLCYNQKRFIKEQFQAILKQDYPGEWEIIISDDFSQDGSFECLEEMVEKEGEGRRIILVVFVPEIGDHPKIPMPR